MNDDTFSTSQIINGCTAVIAAPTETIRNKVIAHSKRAAAFTALAVGNPQLRTQYYRQASDDLAIIKDFYDKVVVNEKSGAYGVSRVEWADAFNNMGEVQFHLLNHTSAIALYTTAIQFETLAAQLDGIRITSSNIRLARYYANRATAYHRRGQFTLAIADYDLALNLRETSFGHLFRGYAHRDNNDPVRAYNDFAFAIQGYGNDLLDPKNAGVQDRLYKLHGDALLASGNSTAALEDYNQALTLSPRSGLAYSGRGQAYLSMKMYNEAIADFTTALNIDQDLSAAMAYRGKAYMQAGDLRAAQTDLVQALAKDPTLRDATADLNIVNAKLKPPQQAAAPAQTILPPPAAKPATTASPPIPVTTVTVPQVTKPNPSLENSSFTSTMTAPKGTRHALVIGINSYPNLKTDSDPDRGQLANPVNDARLMNTVLKDKLNFDVDLVVNPKTSMDISAAVDRVKNKIKQGDTVLIFYSGHGISLQGSNRLLPADIPQLTIKTNETMLRRWSIAETEIIEAFQAAGAGLIINIQDACRNNPLNDRPSATVATKALRNLSSDENYASVPRPITGVFSIYSAARNETALDGGKQGWNNSIFTHVLAEEMVNPSLSLAAMMSKVKPTVTKLAAEVTDPDTKEPHPQHPAYYDELVGDTEFFLAGGPTNIRKDFESATASSASAVRSLPQPAPAH